MKTAAQIRQTFLDFFAERGHRVVPSAPVFPKDDPTLLFTNAGMNQFKDVFLGTGTRDYVRAADTQKCIRVSGKHNDLEEVGRDTYHHTLFEMLGNWSFGDYFKRDSIAWAWELLTGVYGLPKDRLWVTVFGGDDALGLPADEESEALWKEVTDIDPARVLRFGAKDNFWEMGDTGPCGPCTEIHFDRGTEAQDRADGALRDIGVNAGNERFIELWNLVFIQYNRTPEGLKTLPAQHVDTGMGLERVVAVLQGKNSNYDTDLFTPIFTHLEKLSGRTYGRSMSDGDIAFRVIADHVRALCTALSDGALPANDGRGYVLRRLLRRAARFGRQALDMQEPFICRLVPTVAEILGDVFPEVRERQDHVAVVIESEEKAFALTLDKGITLFEKLAMDVESSGGASIPGHEAYDLYATFGFPQDLVELMARERGLEVDSAEWIAAEKAHKHASKGAGGGKYLVDPNLLEGLPATTALFYRSESCDGLHATAHPLRLIEGRVLVLDRTTFYAESGGQVGDTGTIEGDGFRFRVTDTQKMGQLILHVGRVELGDGNSLPASVHTHVDAARRLDIMANHTGTHLLHWALKQVLGDHASQQGSMVSAERLRFDVTHPKAISAEEIERIERMINEKVADNARAITTIEGLDDAKARGVTAMFGEKYDEEVRVLDVGGYSLELCGGTHCEATGQIGAFVVTSEAALQAGVRRIEAVTRSSAVRYLQEQRRALRQVAQALKTSESDIVTRISGLQEQLKELKKGGARQSQADVAGLAKSLLSEAETVAGVALVRAKLEGISAKDVQLLCDSLKAAATSACGIVGLVDGEKVVLATFATKDLAGKRAHAGNVIRDAAKLVGGGGGGRPDFAQAGGKDAGKLEEALDMGAQAFRSGLG